MRGIRAVKAAIAGRAFGALGEAVMTMQAMLMPVFAQVALTFVLLFWTLLLRFQAIRQGQVGAARRRPQRAELAAACDADLQRLP